MSFWGKLGKVALKVAPYAAMAIPGVGIPAAMAISAASNAASTKLAGGSWKQAALSGGIGAGTAAVGAGALKGIGPSSGTLAKLGAGAAGKTAGTGALGATGKVLGTLGTNAAMNAITNRSAGQPLSNSPIGPSSGAVARGTGVPSAPGSVMPRGGFRYNQNPMNQADQSNPNFASSIFQGRNDAMRSQPFRSGYGINAIMEDGSVRPNASQMPAIFPNYYNKKKKQEATQ